MIQTVVKRDGRIVGFNEQKIMAAIRKAMISTEKGEDDSLLQTITDRIAARGSAQMTVEQIQDSVEMELMKSSRKDVAQRYIAYRNQRSIARKAKTRDVFLDIVNIKNNDVTRENSNSITVTTYDGTAYDAQLIGYDESNDIAVLKIDATDLPPVVLGDSDTLNVGDTVVAIGNPLGELTFSLTTGAVSALNRPVTFSTGTTMNLIQTDCAINSGNSGGAYLLRDEGGR